MLLNQEEIEEVEEIIDGKHYKCIGCDCDCSTCEEFVSNEYRTHYQEVKL